jgi:phage terminase small subunit
VAKDGLTLQQQFFVDEYVVDFNQHRAALAAKYSPVSAASQSSQLLKNPKIQKAVREALEHYGIQREVLKQRIINQLANIAFSNIADYGDWDSGSFQMKPSKELTRAQTSAIQEIRHYSSDKADTVTFKLCSKEKAIELLGRHLGMFNESQDDDTPTEIKLNYAKTKNADK